MDLNKIKRDVDLLDFARTNYGIECNSKSKGLCPFHEEKNPSFQIKRCDDEIWRWFDWHLAKGEEGFSGTIIDLVARMDRMSDQEACRKLRKMFSAASSKVKSTEHYPYLDPEGNIVYRKIKQVLEDDTKRFWIELKDGNGWRRPHNNEPYTKYPYNAQKFRDYTKAIICEGEKDADSVNKLRTEYLATSAPFGCKSWTDEMNPCFKNITDSIFLYDVGNEGDAKRHAHKLRQAYPEMHIFIASVPLPNKEADISDYLYEFYDPFQEDYLDTQKWKLIEILDNAKKYEAVKVLEGNQKLIVETCEQFLEKPLPKIERLINPFVERFGYTLIGGVKGVGKSLFVTQMALYYSSGKSGFLNSIIEQPGRVLLIQQEVSKPGMQDRLKKMLDEEGFDTQNRFFPITTTGRPWKLTDKKDREMIITLIEKTQPDVLILDALYTFFPGELNQARDISGILDVLMELKTNYNQSLVVVHHFSNKASPDEPRSTAGRFMGHSNLANAADVLVGLDFLHPSYRERALPLPYNHYSLVETTTRHGEWPARLYIERGTNCLLFQKSLIMDEIGKIVPPNEIVAFVEACGGEKLQADVIEYFQKTKEAHPNTIRKSIDEVVKMGKLIKDTVPGQYGRKVLRTVEAER